MINFNCTNCDKAFSVDEKVAGKKGKCKTCGASIIVPEASRSESEKIVIKFDDPSPSPSQDRSPTATAPSAIKDDGATTSKLTPPRKLPMRTRRLMADAEQVHRLFESFPLIRIQSTEGNPPEKYHIEYNIRGLVRTAQGRPDYRESHLVEIQLTREYPRQGPKCKMLTPIFHPNIEPAAICIGDHWTAGEQLVELIVRIGEIICYQAHNIQSPLDGEAAMWTDKNLVRLPIDSRSLRPPGMD